jgi:hypothetical protein
METPAQRCVRIVIALEDLVAQEGAALANRDFATMLALQERTTPLVNFLVTNAADASEPGLRARITALHSRRKQNNDSLTAEIERTRTDLQQMQVTRRRVARIAPVYGLAAPVRGQWQAVV